MKRCITKGIEEYLSKNNIPWHMPGHKRRGGICTDTCDSDLDRLLDGLYCYDVTEVPGTDDLHNPEGIIKESMMELAKVYNTYASYYLVNGATGGILAAVAAAKEYCGCEEIIIAKNCHKSVYNAAALVNLGIKYIYPKWRNGIQSGIPRDICADVTAYEAEEALKENPGAKILVITSPTYEGIVSDIAAISEVCKKHSALLIVDEAHGAHLPFTPVKSLSAVNSGADVVVQSMHKTLAAMTQTAVMHAMNGDLVTLIEKYLSVFMTSSPSYIMMYSMEKAVCQAQKWDYNAYYERVGRFKDKVRTLKNIGIIETETVKSAGGYAYDESRIVIWSDKLSGNSLAGILERTGRIVVEMSGADYVVLISTPADAKEDFDYLYKILEETDSNLIYEKSFTDNDSSAETQTHEKIRSLCGKAAPEDIYVYPPGSYIVMRGETVTEDIVGRLLRLADSGLKIRGV